MTRNTNSKFPTIKKLLVFVLSILMCLSLFMASACKEEEQAETIPEYSYTDRVDGEISNPSFTFGTQSMEYDDYPKTTIEGWNFTKVASSKSGVVDVSSYGWNDLMTSLYKDEGLLSYVKHINDFDDNDIRDIIKDGDSNKTVSTEEVREYIIKNYFFNAEDQNPGDKYSFLNPGTHASDVDNKVYMLNNYVRDDLNYGCVQTVTSSTEVTLKRGEYAKISVWVKTANLNTTQTIKNYDKPIGANISIKNSFNGSSQSNYGIYNIVNDDWQQYTFYVKADDVFETKFTLQLGLGYDNFAAAGTAYFDDITVELLDNDEYVASIASYTDTVTNTISYNNKNVKSIGNDASAYNANTLYLYDMRVNLAEISSLSNTVSFHSDKTDKAYYDFTKYNNGLLNGNITGVTNTAVVTHKTDLDAPYGITNGIELKLNNPASYTIKLDNNGSPFTLNGENYSAITFFVKNNLNKFYATDIIVNVQDKFGTDIVERPAVATISELSEEWSKYTIVVKNNFDKDKYSTVREFYLELVVGPDEYTSIIDSYALGTVTISSPIVSTGKTYQYASDQDKINKIETEFYQYYKLLSDTATGSTALYAGFNEDYAVDEDNAEVYTFVTASSSIGQIVDNPASPKEYNGIETGHYYITGNEADSMSINTNNYAGLINTKYLDNYEQTPNLSDIKDALDHTESNNIQPLMIKSEGMSYGFISEPHTIPQDSNAKISVKVRVYNATAYIYLVDVSKTEKQVLKLNTFTVNTAEGEYDNNGQEINKELFLAIDETMLDDNGWVTVNFYIATGATEKEIRLELWNGARDNTNALTQNGYVFFNDVEIAETNAFIEPSSWQEALTEDDSPLFNLSFENQTDLVLYKRELTDLEKQYNAEDNDSTISYNPTYVWAKTYKLVYAIYNTIDPIEVDPYDSDAEEEATPDAPLYETDPATFWLSLSSIIIGVALIVAIIMLLVRNIRRRRKANRNDAKSHYTVRSRTRKPSNKVVEEIDVDIDIDVDSPTTNEDGEEQSLDSYVYGEVNVFGEEESEKNDNND